MLRRLVVLSCSALALAAACAPVAPSVVTGNGAPPALVADSGRLMRDLRILAHDSMQGRRVGTEGSQKAQRFLLAEFARIGLAPLGTGYGHGFRFTRQNATLEGRNIVGLVRGTQHPDRYIVVTAHYDHLGVMNGQIYNGADDNASGTAALLELARHYVRNPPRHSIVFAALDAEEGGLNGAIAFVESPPVPREAIVQNVNMDMVGRNDRNELYAAGTWHYPALRPLLEAIQPAAPVVLRFGHDSPDLPRTDDWTTQSDHAAFHRAGIPFVYFGVEDHPDYHQPSDTADRIQPVFFAGAVDTVYRAIQAIDGRLNGARTPAR